MPTLKPNLKAGTLFPAAARTAWMELTGSRYSAMKQRLKKLGLEVPFTLYEFRQDVLSVQEGGDDGPIKCRYCQRWFTLQEIAVDHAVPLSRNGGLGLKNVDYPCKQDNDRKGSLTVEEYAQLLADLEKFHPLARKDILSRLEKANALMQGATRSRILIAKLAGEGKIAPKVSKKQQEFAALEEFGPF